ncbi:fructosamine kinase family protein [Kushneria aurantia]|uniref:Fructosamine kinase family protein n=1 Tax=Kushneria aurantia TaxID=504092 RepID=A0ABV6G485_9GAMM|nr:fructosamine kinase family protein [Kushneria aurantia]
MTPLETLQALDIRATGEARPLSGGDIGRVWHVPTEHGELLVKHADSDALSAEAEGLEALRDAASGLLVPEVVGLLEGALVMTFLPPTRPSKADQQRLGEGLRKLHDHTVDEHGWHRDNFAGTTPQINTPNNDGRVFQREQRIMALARRCRDQGRLDAALYERLERIAHALESWLPNAPASLLHGDLWSGNVHFSDKGPALIDPAVYRHYRDVDIAMLELFGTPDAAFFEAYWNAGAPDDWPRRRALFQLYPLLNHLHLFGGAYLSGVRAAAERLPER